MAQNVFQSAGIRAIHSGPNESLSILRLRLRLSPNAFIDMVNRIQYDKAISSRVLSRRSARLLDFGEYEWEYAGICTFSRKEASKYSPPLPICIRRTGSFASDTVYIFALSYLRCFAVSF